LCPAGAGSLGMRIPALGPERQKIKLIVRKYQGARKAKTVERIHPADHSGSGNEATVKGRFWAELASADRANGAAHPKINGAAHLRVMNYGDRYDSLSP
jgi:hypothetical protein